jgi:hypothetical protein
MELSPASEGRMMKRARFTEEQIIGVLREPAMIATAKLQAKKKIRRYQLIDD